MNFKLLKSILKALDLTQDASDMTAKEIRVEPRAFVGIELPRGWRVGIRSHPFRKVAEILKPILSQHAIKLDSVIVFDVSAHYLEHHFAWLIIEIYLFT